jgi:hypothetical protein
VGQRARRQIEATVSAVVAPVTAPEARVWRARARHGYTPGSELADHLALATGDVIVLNAPGAPNPTADLWRGRLVADGPADGGVGPAGLFPRIFVELLEAPATVAAVAGSRPVHITPDHTKYRCEPAADSGGTVGSDRGATTFCLAFARGCCAEGEACVKLHRVPVLDDEAWLNYKADIFGRSRAALNSDWEQRHEQKEAGAAELENSTLYVGKLPGIGTKDHWATTNVRSANYSRSGPVAKRQKSASATQSAAELMEEAVRREFAAWGEVYFVRVLYDKLVAFVTYARLD